MSVVGGLDGPCGVCERPTGDHTLREWSACMEEVTTDLPFESTPADAAALASASLRDRFNLDDSIIIADHVTVKAITLDGEMMGVPPRGPASLQRRPTVRVPGLLHEFGIGVPGIPPSTVASVLFVGGVDSVRKYGRLARDSANGAANAAERGR